MLIRRSVAAMACTSPTTSPTQFGVDAIGRPVEKDTLTVVQRHLGGIVEKPAPTPGAGRSTPPGPARSRQQCPRSTRPPRQSAPPHRRATTTWFASAGGPGRCVLDMG